MSRPAKPQRHPVPEPGMPATERIEALSRLRQANGGLVAPRPAVITAPAVRAWLAEIAAKGMREDVDAAWYAFDHKQVKEQLYNDWQSLRMQAEQSFYKLASEAELERTKARHRWQREQGVVKLRKEIASLESQLAAKRQQLVQLSA